MHFSSIAPVVLSSLFYLLSVFANAEQIIRYPKADSTFAKHHQYPIELLKLALSYHPEKITIQESDHFMTQGRAIKQLKARKDIDVMWTMTSEKRESEIRPIRIPIYKGLIGWRLFLCTEEWLQNHKEKPLNLENLKQERLIQGHDWPDTMILKQNHFNVISGSNYEGLFHFLSLRRADLFPRSIVEIWNEVDIYRSSNIRLEPHTLISYPTASYFFVSPDNQVLANIIEDGLNKAHEDGRFNQLFNQYYQAFIDQSDLPNRQHFRLVNPLLPKNTPVDIAHYWFQLDESI